MIINHNMSAINANRNVGIVNREMNNAFQKLGSGFRINKAADDAAGLTMSEKMRSQVAGLDKASENITNGIQLFGTAEGGMQEIQKIYYQVQLLMGLDLKLVIAQCLVLIL